MPPGSRYLESESEVIGLIKTDAPITKVVFATMEPYRFPTNISDSLSFKERRENANSGKDVPIAIIKSPIIKVEIFISCASLPENLTIVSAEKSIKAIPVITLARLFHFPSEAFITLRKNLTKETPS